jgi:hypothetical protein
MYAACCLETGEWLLVCEQISLTLQVWSPFLIQLGAAWKRKEREKRTVVANTTSMDQERMLLIVLPFSLISANV